MKRINTQLIKRQLNYLALPLSIEEQYKLIAYLVIQLGVKVTTSFLLVRV